MLFLPLSLSEMLSMIVRIVLGNHPQQHLISPGSWKGFNV